MCIVRMGVASIRNIALLISAASGGMIGVLRGRVSGRRVRPEANHGQCGLGTDSNSYPARRGGEAKNSKSGNRKCLLHPHTLNDTLAFKL